MDDEPSLLWWWKELVDPLCGDESRWSSSNTGPVQSPDLIGDALVAKLLHCARSVQNDRPIAGWSKTLFERLGGYEDEPRLLVKLADTGRVVRLLERGIDTTLHILDIYSADRRDEWREQLRLERENRMTLYEELLARKDLLGVEMGDEVQQEEVLTLMKHGMEKFGEFLNPRELDVVSAIFDAIVSKSTLVVGVLPTWFTASRPDNARQTNVYEGEEACLRQVFLWASLHHPNIRKFYGACHVGTPSVLHEEDQQGPATWSFFRDCAFGLEYVHRRGFTHNKLTASALCYRKDEKRGILSGVGLRKLRDDHTGMNDANSVFDLHPDISEDMEAFGRAIFVMLAQHRGQSNIELYQQLPSSKPEFLSEGEWNLLETLRTSSGFGISDCFKRMEELDKVERKESRSEIFGYTLGEEDRNNQPVEDITSYILPTAGRTISDLLQDAYSLCEAVSERAGMNRSVYNRLIDLYDQFVRYPSSLPLELVETYALIVWDFVMKLEGQSDTLCSASSLCPSRTIANRNHSLHHDIDSLIAQGSDVLKSSDVHAWKFRTCCPTIGDELEFEDNEEDKFLQTSGTFTLGDTVSSRPTWFIPVEEVNRKAPIANGAFGAVYEASWLGTSVVLKQVFEANKGHRKQFYREANLWFHLSHKNLIQLYGANHGERPFFVCEKAVGKTLPDFLKREKGSRLWKCIQQAALGLENLHNQGIIHGDLKGDNLLVWMAHVTVFESAITKVADFGMSIRANGMAPLVNTGDLGALPWRAPEILSGGPPSFASDIYSFGMCIIEAATGAYPAQWRVTQERWAPPRPKELSEDRWNLITRMCCFDALKRIDAGAIVNILHNGAFDGRYRNDTSHSDDNPKGDGGSKEIGKPALAPKPVYRPRNRWHRRNCPANVIRTPDRLGDYLVALRNDFVLKHQTCRRGLNLSGELSAYEKETRVLLKLASTGRIVNILLRFGGVIEGYMKVMDIKATEEVIAWKEQLEVERQQRVELFNKILKDEQRLVEAMGDETQQMELMTLLKHDVANYSAILTPEELDVMSDAYDRVVEHLGIVLVGKPPSWFLSPNDLLCENGVYYFDAVRVSKCLTEEVLSTVTDHESWEDQEEACLRQAVVWADLNHPHVAKMLGACHIGKEPFVVHEPVEPLAANRANAQSWELVLGWALGLQYLHERELGYKNFDDNRLLARHHVTASGVLTGLGLVPVKRNTPAPLKHGVSNTFSMKDLEPSLQQPDTEDSSHDSPCWSVPNDIFAFGLALYNTRQWVSMYSVNDALVLPPECPPFLDEEQWDLVQRMCARIPHSRVSMWYVVHQLLAFVQSSEPEGKNKYVDLSPSLEDAVDDEGLGRLPERIDDFMVPKMNVNVVKAMVSLERMCGEWDESGLMLKNVFNRLSSLHSQFQTRDNIKDATKIMKAFVNVVDLFYTELTRRNIEKNQSQSSEVATFCASRTAAQNITVFHHEIDRLLTLAQLRDTSASAQAPPSHVMLADIREDSTDSINAVPGIPDIHDWHIEWRKMRREQLRAFRSCLQKAEELKEQLRDPDARLEAQMLLQFELLKRPSSYPDSVLDAMTEALKVLETMGDGAEAVPSWFIPPYEVVLGKRIAEGDFGEVYYGSWFDTVVVVKILKSQPTAPTSSSGLSEEDTMQLFRSEADYWFMLNHQHVVHLYGACHVGTPFFVCEPAKPTSLSSHVKELACAKPGYNFEENGGDRSDIMRCLFLAGLGLKYLHERGIIHCDLKGNTFMVGTDGKTIKLGDFGMSVLKRSGSGRHAAHENVGAVAWKAPEYLQGYEPTVMSDVYSFGMCIFELLSGKTPWNGLPEAAVRFHVTKRKALPPRPKKLDDFQWSLIQHMCCFEPNERISLDAVVDMLHTFRFEK